MADISTKGRNAAACRSVWTAVLACGFLGQPALGQHLVLPDAPSEVAVEQAAAAQPPGTIRAAVTDPDGSEVVGAKVTLVHVGSGVRDTIITDSNGLFDFPDLTPGRYNVAISATGFAAWNSGPIDLGPGVDQELPDIALQVASASSQVDVVYSQYDIAEDQIHLEEQQRIFAVFPNFDVSYVWNAAPLTPGQKFKLAFRSSTDPGFFLVAGLVAGFEQASNDFPGYGQGAAAFGKRFGAASADGFDSGMLGGAIFPSLFRQDPRYFYKGTGSVVSRALYAISTVVICKSDKGKWQPNYSNVLGNLASAGISNLYYPASDRHGAGATIDNALIGTASGAFSSLMQEFVLRKFTPHKKSATPTP